MGFLDSASSLCDMMNTTMAAVLNEIMSIQADEACGAEYGARTEARVNSRNGLCTHASLDLTHSPHCLLAFALDRREVSIREEGGLHHPRSSAGNNSLISQVVLEVIEVYSTRGHKPVPNEGCAQCLDSLNSAILLCGEELRHP